MTPEELIARARELKSKLPKLDEERPLDSLEETNAVLLMVGELADAAPALADALEAERAKVASKDAEIERQRLLLVANQAIIDGEGAEIARLKSALLKPEINTHVRMFDLVRYSRAELHEAELITDEEYSWLCSSLLATSPKGGSPSRKRLEDYDELRARMKALESENATLRAELDAAKADSAMLDAVERLRIAITPCYGTPTPMGSGTPTPFEGFVTDPNDPNPKPLRAAIADAMKGEK